MKIELTGQRTNCRTGETRDVHLVLEDRYHPSKYMREWWVHVTEGGVTGYESIKVTSILRNEAFDILGGWCACAGTKNRWDTLFIPGHELIRLRDALRKEYIDHGSVPHEEIVD